MVLLERTTNNLDTLHTLEVLGVRISLDDFGTRYSSLAYLKNFPFDTIKIDRYFIKDVVTDDKSQTIVHSIISLAHGLGMRVVAEGVENAAQADWLRRRGCDRLLPQGGERSVRNGPRASHGGGPRHSQT